MKKTTEISENTETLKKKKSRAPILVLIILLLIAGLSGAGYYIYLREQPKKEVSRFLDYAQAFNVEGMASCVKNQDLGDLENNRLNVDSYQTFFQAVNEKMSYEITGLDFKNTSATVTAKITYFDGTETYKEAISEFFRSGMQQLFTGGDMTPAQNEELLSEILTEKAKDLPDTLTTTTIKYPCEKENGNWIITEVNEDTINVITANFGAFTTELEESEENLNSLESDGTAGDSGTESSDPSSSDDGVLNYTCDNFTLVYDRYELSEDYSGNQCLLVYYNYTNNSDEASQPMVNVSLRAMQNGETCSAAFPVDHNTEMDNYMAEIPAGETVSVCQSFELKDTSDVTMELSEAYSFNEDVDTQIIQIAEQ